MEMDENLQRVEQFKIKKMMRFLRDAKGNGTSMITLIIPPSKKIVDITNKLVEEFSKASNIKDKTTSKSVEKAITSARERLKLYQKTPKNGLILYCGEILEADGKTEKKILIDFEPYKQINTSKYYCDSKFHVEDLSCLLDTDLPFGFIIIDGNGTLFAILQGNSREILYRMNVELPKKHRKGGQSSVRFARLRVEKRHNYVTKVSEKCVECFIENDRPNVCGLILAGSADFKNELFEAQSFDPRLKEKVVKIIDTSYGGENGFYQAIELSKDSLLNIKFVQEKDIISKFFEEIKTDSGKYVYGVKDTMRALEAGAVEKLLVYEECDYFRIKLLNKETGVESCIYLKPDQLENKDKYFHDPDTKVELETVESLQLTDWLAENYSKFGCDLQFITDKSPEGFQFAKGFTGVGGFLRFKFDVEQLQQGGEEYQDQEEDDFI